MWHESNDGQRTDLPALRDSNALDGQHLTGRKSRHVSDSVCTLTRGDTVPKPGANEIELESVRAARAHQKKNAKTRSYILPNKRPHSQSLRRICLSTQRVVRTHKRLEEHSGSPRVVHVAAKRLSKPFVLRGSVGLVFRESLPIGPAIGSRDL